ncbi:hypothetical protein SADUNF_Sadunf14G0017900 [Salix dunnii]|uniref:EF-hand domain-containing protein n=1 Tax=Salix dunnii TaxID=1413687 RepID=A0A835JHH5_9ROSI|nr:hypothetical protein SADUNF_Sadunf14G0017900 [Salix dunnii]
MAIHDVNVAMNKKEFEAWVRKNIDADEDGKISKDELADIIRRKGEWFAGLKAWKWIRSADSNRNGVVDENEISNLEEFAQKLPACPKKTLAIDKMAIKSCRISVDGKRVMSIEEFKRWLKTFDTAEKNLKMAYLEGGLQGGRASEEYALQTPMAMALLKKVK